MARKKGMYVLDPTAADRIYASPERSAIAELIDINPVIHTREQALADPALADCEIILSGWGGPRLDESFLAAAPKLKAFLYGAGAVGGVITESTWNRGVQVSSAYGANAKPVAEYTLGMILLSLKNAFRLSAGIREAGRYPVSPRVAGCFGSTVGLISLSMIGRSLLQLLKPFDLQVIAYDPFVTATEARALGVELVSLDEIFTRSDIVSLHTPLLKETVGMITGRHLQSMKEGATFINTARGAIVREMELIEVLKRRTDLQAILDVTAPEPPVAGSPLYSMSNVILTPHLAGSQDSECRRMGQWMIEELRRYLKGEPLQWAVTREASKFSTHRPIADS